MSKYIVPIEIPKYCDDCPFGHLHYYHPFYANRARIDLINKKKTNQIRMVTFVILIFRKTENIQKSCVQNVKKTLKSLNGAS